MPMLRFEAIKPVLVARIFMLFVLFMLQIPVLNSQQVRQGQGNEVILVHKFYKIQISREPFSLTISYSDKPIMKLTALFSEDSSGQSASFSLVKSFNDEKKAVFLIAGTNGQYFDLQIKYHDRGADLEINPADNRTKQKLGIRLDAAVSGHWFGGNVVNAHMWPLETHEFKVDRMTSSSNQASPVWLTTGGLALIADTYNTLGYSFSSTGKGIFELFSRESGSLTIRLGFGNDIRQAYYSVSDMLGKPVTIPPKDFFKYPQFNTWIEFMTKVNQVDVEKYTRSIRSNGFQSRIFMIDDKWTGTYGDFDFDRTKFPDPGKMVEQLHNDGLKVALWVTPFIEKAAANFSYASEKKYLVKNANDDNPLFVSWWNGQAALVDFSNPEAYTWFLDQLQNLQKKYGVDGFKLDGGDASFLEKPHRTYGNITPNEYADLYVSLGKYFEINEFKIGWFAQNLGLVQRLRDKAPNYNEKDGIKSIIPHALTAGLIGYSFLCPDMIGGGLDGGFLAKDYKFDEELFVRWAQASALMPMMQYSLAPWRLSKESLAICKKYTDLHVSLGDYIYDLAKESKSKGTPIVRSLSFEYPGDEKTFLIYDQFMLGDRFLVAPVLDKGATSRSIYLPEGTWIDYWSGKVTAGGQTVQYMAPIDVLPIFINVK